MDKVPLHICFSVFPFSLWHCKYNFSSRIGFFFWGGRGPHYVACRILVTRWRMESSPSAVKARNPNHWTFLFLLRVICSVLQKMGWSYQKVMPGFTAFVAYSWTILQKGYIDTRSNTYMYSLFFLWSTNPITWAKIKRSKKKGKWHI